MNYNNEHNICPQESSNDFLTLDTVHVTSEIHFNQISSVLDIPIEDIRRYNPQYKQDKIPGNHKSYALVLPTKDIYAFLSNKDDILDHNRSIYLTHRKETLTESNDGTTVTGDFINTYYKIKKGDTLGAIARRNGTTVSRLQSMNNMRSTKLSIGKSLVVRQTPRPTPAKEDIQETNTVLASGENVKNTYYRVKKGDTLGAIASRNQTSVAQLQNLNKLKSTRLSIGDNLIVKQTIEPQQEEVETANKEINHQRSDSVSTPNSGNIVTEYLNKKLELSKDNT